MIFLLVGIAGYRLRSETGALGAIVLVGIAATAIVLAFFAVDTLRNAPETFVAIVAIAVARGGPRPRLEASPAGASAGRERHASAPLRTSRAA